MKVDGIHSIGAQMGRYEPVVQSLEHPNVRNLEASAGCKEVYHLHEEEVVENHWEILWEELELVSVGMVEAVGGLAGQEQDQHHPNDSN